MCFPVLEDPVRMLGRGCRLLLWLQIFRFASQWFIQYLIMNTLQIKFLIRSALIFRLDRGKKNEKVLRFVFSLQPLIETSNEWCTYGVEKLQKSSGLECVPSSQVKLMEPEWRYKRNENTNNSHLWRKWKFCRHAKGMRMSTSKTALYPRFLMFDFASNFVWHVTLTRVNIWLGANFTSRYLYFNKF